MTYLYESILAQTNDIYPFHMPGHKRNKDFFPFNFADIDITETIGTDNLHNLCDEEGIIYKSLENAAKACYADKSYYLVNGATAGIIAAITAVSGENDSVLIARNCHKSVYNGLAFSGANLEYIMPQITSDGLIGGINPSEVDKKLTENTDIKAVVITSPTYDGFVSDIAAISESVHRRNCILIVDEAHGAHFPYHDYFPKTACLCGADIVVQSLHKTLPALTQVSILHVNGSLVDREKLQYTLSMVQTSSPSYIFMAVADYVIKRMKTDRILLENYINNLKKLNEKLLINKKIRLAGKEQIGKSAVYDTDLGRLCFITNGTDITGGQLEEVLRDNYKIGLEYSRDSHAVGITSPADTEDGFTRLADAIAEIEEGINEKHEPVITTPLPEPVTAMPIKKACNTTVKKIIDLSKSEGKVSAEFIIPYPPGIPVIVPGEVITGNVINIIKHKTKIIKILEE